jgi:hypothetical protein
MLTLESGLPPLPPPFFSLRFNLDSAFSLSTLQSYHNFFISLEPFLGTISSLSSLLCSNYWRLSHTFHSYSCQLTRCRLTVSLSQLVAWLQIKPGLQKLDDASQPELFFKARSRLHRLWTSIATDSCILEYAACMIAMLSLHHTRN